MRHSHTLRQGQARRSSPDSHDRGDYAPHLTLSSFLIPSPHTPHVPRTRHSFPPPHTRLESPTAQRSLRCPQRCQLMGIPRLCLLAIGAELNERHWNAYGRHDALSVATAALPCPRTSSSTHGFTLRFPLRHYRRPQEEMTKTCDSSMLFYERGCQRREEPKGSRGG